MKKTFRNPDGTEDVVEGTPEEIAAYERARQQKPQNEGRKKPGVLKGAPREEGEIMLRELRDELLRRIAEIPPPTTIYQYPPVWSQPCFICGKVGCMETHIWCGVSEVDAGKFFGS